MPYIDPVTQRKVLSKTLAAKLFDQSKKAKLAKIKRAQGRGDGFETLSDKKGARRLRRFKAEIKDQLLNPVTRDQSTRSKTTGLIVNPVQSAPVL